MKKQIEYNEQGKTLLLTVEALKNAGGLPEEVAEKGEEFCEYLTDYIYGDFFYSYNPYLLHIIYLILLYDFTQKEFFPSFAPPH